MTDDRALRDECLDGPNVAGPLCPQCALRSDPRLHVTTLIDEAELELRADLELRAGVDVLALLRFALVIDRGSPMLACAGAPPAEAIARMPDASRLELARGLRAVANVLDPA